MLSVFFLLLRSAVCYLCLSVQERVLTQHYVGSAFILLGLLLVLCFGVHTPPPLSLDQLLQLYSQNSCVLYFCMSILAISFCIYVSIAGRDLPDTSAARTSGRVPNSVSSGKHHEMQLLASRNSSSVDDLRPPLSSDGLYEGKLTVCTPTHSVSAHSYPPSLQCTTHIPTSRSPSLSPPTLSASSSFASASCAQQSAPCPPAALSLSPPPLPATPGSLLGAARPPCGEEHDSYLMKGRETTAEEGSLRDEVHTAKGEGAAGSWLQHSSTGPSHHKRDSMAGWTGEDWAEDTELGPHLTFLHSRGSGAREEFSSFRQSCLLGSSGVQTDFDEHPVRPQVEGAGEPVTFPCERLEISRGSSRALEENTTASSTGKEGETNNEDDAVGNRTEVDGSWQKKVEPDERSSSLLFFPVAVRRFCTAAVSGMCGGNTNILMEHVMKVRQTSGSFFSSLQVPSLKFSKTRAHGPTMYTLRRRPLDR